MRFLAISLTVLSLTAPAQAQSVWVASQTRKIRPNDPVGPTRPAALEAAQNEFEAFHVVVAGGAKGAAGVRVTASGLVGPKGAAKGVIEIKNRRTGQRAELTPEAAIARFAAKDM